MNQVRQPIMPVDGLSARLTTAPTRDRLDRSGMAAIWKIGRRRWPSAVGRKQPL